MSSIDKYSYWGLGVVINPFVVMDYSLSSYQPSENHISISYPIEPGIKTTAKPGGLGRRPCSERNLRNP